MDSENGDLHGDGAAEEGIPTYDEAFPSLPELSETQRLMAEVQKSTWAATAIKPSLTTQVGSYFLIRANDSRFLQLRTKS
jgi:hypothetical protein